LGQARDLRLYLGVWCLKSQIPSTPPKERRAGKLQINPPAIARHERAGLKFQITNSKPVQRAAQVLAPRERLFFFVWDFEFRSLLFVCFLGFVIWNFNNQ